MATNFSEIYCLSNLLKNDSRLSKLPSYLYNSLCWSYLQVGLGFCSSVISSETENYIQKLIDLTEPIEMSYEFIADGIETVFLLTPPPQINSEIYVALKSGDEYTEVFNYVFDNALGTVTFDTIPEEDVEILIVTFTDGYFTETLEYALKLICAEAMDIAFLEEHQNDRKLLNMYVYSNNFKIHSAADHTRANNFVVRDQRAYVEKLLVDYSYSNTGQKMTGLLGVLRL